MTVFQISAWALIAFVSALGWSVHVMKCDDSKINDGAVEMTQNVDATMVDLSGNKGMA